MGVEPLLQKGKSGAFRAFASNWICEGLSEGTRPQKGLMFDGKPVIARKQKGDEWLT